MNNRSYTSGLLRTPSGTGTNFAKTYTRTKKNLLSLTYLTPTLTKGQNLQQQSKTKTAHSMKIKTYI